MPSLNGKINASMYMNTFVVYDEHQKQLQVGNDDKSGSCYW